MWLAGERLLTVGNGTRVVTAEIADRGPLVPAFCEIGRARGDATEDPLSLVQILTLHGGHAFAEELVHFGDAGMTPHGPQRRFALGHSRGIGVPERRQRLSLGHTPPPWPDVRQRAGWYHRRPMAEGIDPRRCGSTAGFAGASDPGGGLGGGRGGPLR